MDTPAQDFFVRDMLFNLESVVDWQVVTDAKKRQVDIDNDRETPSESRMTTLLDINFMWKWLASTENLIIGNRDRIESMKSLQTVQLYSNADKLIK